LLGHIPSITYLTCSTYYTCCQFFRVVAA
jgi:hypothetical protein